MSSSLCATYQYSDVAPAPRRVPSLRMLSPDSPSASRISIAARTICSRVSVGCWPPLARGGRSHTELVNGFTHPSYRRSYTVRDQWYGVRALEQCSTHGGVMPAPHP